MEKTVWETEDFEMKNPAKKEVQALTSRRHYAVVILQACGVAVEPKTEPILKRVEAILTAYKTNRGKVV